jgi:hypothetical protein
MNLKSFFTLLKNPKLAEEGRAHIRIDYTRESDLEELEELDNSEKRRSDIKESA